MFVSSYNTYIATNQTDKTAKTIESSTHKKNIDFKNSIPQPTQTSISTIKSTPINYIQASKIQANREKLSQYTQATPFCLLSL